MQYKHKTKYNITRMRFVYWHLFSFLYITIFFFAVRYSSSFHFNRNSQIIFNIIIYEKILPFFWVSRLLLLHLLLFYYNLNTICACLLLFPFCYNNYFIFVMILLLVQIVVFFSLRSFIRFIDSSFIYAVTFFRPT